jgi:hypothetical protein
MIAGTIHGDAGRQPSRADRSPPPASLPAIQTEGPRPASDRAVFRRRRAGASDPAWGGHRLHLQGLDDQAFALGDEAEAPPVLILKRRMHLRRRTERHGQGRVGPGVFDLGRAPTG